MDASAASETPLAPLRPPHPIDVEIRVVIWTCRDLSLRLCYDESTGEPREHIDILAKIAIDCRTYNGSKAKEQETDVHHHSDGEGEFNWRFVFPNIQVTKGVPLDCFLQMSIFEHFAFARPKLMCETMVEMKNYCKKVALTGEMIQLDAELPLENQALKRQLKMDRAGGGQEVDLDGDDDDDDGGGGGDDDDSDAGGAEIADDIGGGGGDGEEVPIPPAGLLKVPIPPAG